MTSMLRLCVYLTVLFSCAQVSAHAFAPAAVLIEESSPRHYHVTFRRGAQLAAALSLQFPRSCQQGARESRVEGDQLIDRFELSCPSQLQGQTVRMLGLAQLSIGAVLHAQFLDGRSVRELLSAQRTSLSLPSNSWLAEVFFGYLRLGVEHLLTGLDHVLFVVGLLCLVQGLRSILWTLTAFTVGHSVTLCLSSLSIVALPQAPVEVGIALSLLVVALEIVRTLAPLNHAHATLRPVRIAIAFGLLHGLGFAGALAEIGLPEDEIPLSLFSFNLGVELGQILVVCATLPVLWLLRKLLRDRERSVRLSAAYLIGSLSWMWCLERVAALFA